MSWQLLKNNGSREKKRAEITLQQQKKRVKSFSEGERQEAINISEGEKQKRINYAQGKAQEIELPATATAERDLRWLPMPSISQAEILP